MTVNRFLITIELSLKFSLKFVGTFELTIFVLLKGLKGLKTDYVYADVFEHLLAALTDENRLALSVSLCTGLRISDVLNLRTKRLKERMTVRELKTGKTRRIRIPRALLDELIAISGKIFVFENRIDYTRPRTRQAVFKDLKRACRAFRLPAKLNLAPHSARKIYGVSQYERTCSVERVRELLNHSGEAVTMLYAMADKLTERKLDARSLERINRLHKSK